MSNTILIKRSSEASKVPTTSDLQAGELGINITDKKLYSSDGVAVFQIGVGDMLKSTYDTDNDGIVDAAESISGSPTASQYYGTNDQSVKGFYDLPTGGGANFALTTAWGA